MPEPTINAWSVIEVTPVPPPATVNELKSKLNYLGDINDALDVINSRCLHDEKLGTVEVYVDGSFNVFLKQNKPKVGWIVTGMFTYRVENK